MMNQLPWVWWLQQHWDVLGGRASLYAKFGECCGKRRDNWGKVLIVIWQPVQGVSSPSCHAGTGSSPSVTLRENKQIWKIGYVSVFRFQFGKALMYTMYRSHKLKSKTGANNQGEELSSGTIFWLASMHLCVSVGCVLSKCLLLTSDLGQPNLFSSCLLLWHDDAARKLSPSHRPMFPNRPPTMDKLSFP